MLPIFKVIQIMASMNYFDCSRKNITYFFKWKSVMEMHVITKPTNLRAYSCFSYTDNYKMLQLSY
jgi:hypothetical protein